MARRKRERKEPDADDRQTFGEGVSRGMGRGARRGFARGMRAARQRLRGLGGEKSAPPESKRGKGTKSFAAILRRTA